MVQACLNGNRRSDEHPALPLSAHQLALDARAAQAAGAYAVHIHPRANSGHPTLDAQSVAHAVSTIRRLCPALPVGVSTTQAIDVSLERRVTAIQTWTILPDFASVNFWEDGAVELSNALNKRGVGIEAGLSTPQDIEAFLTSGLTGRRVRILVELGETSPEAALATADHLMQLLSAANVAQPRLIHGEEETAWPLLRWGLAHGQHVRIGFEDVLTLPGGQVASSNADLVRAALQGQITP